MKTILTISLILVIVFNITACDKKPVDHTMEGIKYFEESQYIKALPHLEAAYEIEMNNPDVVWRLAICKLEVEHDIGSAINILQDDVLNNPEHALSYYHLGYIAYQYGSKEDEKNINQATMFMRQAAKFDPYNPEILENLAELFIKSGEIDSALTRLTILMDLKQGDENIIYKYQSMKRLVALRDSIQHAKDSH